MANERHGSQGQECSNTLNGVRAGSEPTTDQYQVVPALRWAESKQTGSRESGLGEVDSMCLIGPWSSVVCTRPWVQH
jgi:hypothetical protein